MTRLREEEGSTLLLTIFYAALSLALILLVVAATSLYLERKRLFTLADGASLLGAESFTLADPTAPTAHGVRPILTSPEVASAVSDYLADNPADSFTSLRVERAVSVDGRSATVELSCYWAPPVLTLFVPKGLRIEVTSIARSVFS
ncbi:MAG TPA: pilus assembly protein TadG-related protein [Galbitalea sp.]|jgi:uncharacterized membrane protein